MSSLTFLPAQEAVIRATSGRVYAVAAAGSGKTTTAVERVRQLGYTGCLLIAYNKDAAKSIRSKLGPRGRAADARTLHSWCLARIRALYPRAPWAMPDRIIGVPKGPSAAELVFAALRELDDHDYEDWREYHGAYGIVREEMAAGVDFADALRRGLQRAAPLAPSELSLWRERFAAYEQIKQKRHAIDFADFACIVLGLARERGPQWTAEHLVGSSVLHVTLDEAQDANAARWAIFDLIAEACIARGGSALAVGDPRQSIYAFSGARPDLLNARLEDAAATTIHMPTTLRNTRQIVETGNRIATFMALPETQARANAPEGEPVEAHAYSSIRSEVQTLVTRLRADAPDGITPADMAVIARTHSTLVHIECAFALQGVGCVKADGSGGMWETQPAAWLLAYMRTWEARGVTWASLKILNRPTRYAKVAGIVAALKAQGGSAPVLRPSDLFDLGRGYGRLAMDLRPWLRMPWAAAVEQAFEWLVAPLTRDGVPKTIEAADRIEILEALAEELTRAGSVEAALALPDALKTAPHRVTLSTAHAAKGLEWPWVHVAHVDVDQWPHSKAADPDEERRLFYVAVTRAIHRCSVGYTEGEASSLLRTCGLLPLEGTV